MLRMLMEMVLKILSMIAHGLTVPQQSTEMVVLTGIATEPQISTTAGASVIRTLPMNTLLVQAVITTTSTSLLTGPMS